MNVFPRVICIGGAAVDRKYRAQDPVRLGTSNPVTTERTPGGVARNVAENLARLGAHVSLVSIVGDDDNGRFLQSGLTSLGVDIRGMRVSRDRSTAEYVAVLQPTGDLAVGLADMGIFEGLHPDAVLAPLADADAGDWIFADCNLPAPCLHALVSHAGSHSLSLAVDAVSGPKVRRLPEDLTGISLLFLNGDEAAALLEIDAGPDLDLAGLASQLLDRGAGRVVLTRGPHAFIVADASGISALRPMEAAILDATGAGDALIAATIHGLATGCDLTGAARLGSVAAALTVESPFSVRPDLSLALLKARISEHLLPEAPSP
ncbi:carbohydrate kinase family protein [Microvirga pudoricolor]|uniref:carbohydrate kinase family protein n=1 Tax=Microvirga pudoricolor TaxID=2778729 RepID=UPI0019528FA1|nr:carbohydrate kinase family protein [Microvirga pudoricolor]MBM6593242.1 carbohydrate kinase family protein [Microvirga pudoricolor]